MADTHPPLFGAVIEPRFLAQYPANHPDPRLRNRWHTGVDIVPFFASYPVKPVADGVIRWVSRESGGNKSGFVIIEHNLPGVGRCYARYGHLALDGLLTRFRRGQRVRKSVDLALVDKTKGHLHLDILRVMWPYYAPVHSRRMIERYFVDPTQWIAG